MSQIILKCHAPKSRFQPATDWVETFDAADAIDAVDAVSHHRERGWVVQIEGDVVAFLAASTNR